MSTDLSGEDFKKEMLGGAPKMGLFLNSHSPTVAEQLSHSGYDWLLVDTQHGPMGDEKLSAMLAAIANGNANMVVGTHALFQEQVKFQKLALVIIDEQHRFGVDQRLELREKGEKDGRYPHQLIMTATPIPRTLAMTAYADLDTSVIDELPPGRTPITTVAVSDQRRQSIIDRIRIVCTTEKRQVYWVCTLVWLRPYIEVLNVKPCHEKAMLLLLPQPDTKVVKDTLTR